MSEYDFLLSEKPQVETLPYSKWSDENSTEDSLDSRKKYADYMRSSYLDADAYDESVESEILDGLYSSSINKGFINDDDEGRAAITASTLPSLDEQLKAVSNTLSSDTPEWQAINKYDSFRKVVAKNPNVTEDYLALGEEYRVAAEEVLANSYDDALRTKVRNNELPFAKVKNADGKSEILVSDLASSMPLKDALLESKSAGINLSDAFSAKKELETPEGYSLPLYKLKRVFEATSMIETLAKSDEDIAASIDGYALRLARSEYDFGDKVGEVFNAGGQKVVDVIQRALGHGKEVDENQEQREKSKAAAMAEFATTAESITSKLNSSGALRDSESFSVQEVQLAMNELGVNVANNKSYFKFHDDEDIGKNIRNYGYGLPSIAPSLMANKAKFDQALASREDITPEIKAQMEGQRKVFVDSQFQQFNELLKRSDVSDDWMNTLQSARAKGQKDSATLESFLSDEDNYNEFSARAKGIGMSVVDGFGQLLAAIPAAMGADFAQDYLADVAQKSSDRQELANLFGVELGMTQEIGEAVAPMLVDMAATTLLSLATLPAAGVGGAVYLAAKQGARLTVKGVVKGITSNALRAGVGETAEAAAKRLVAEGLIKESVKDVGSKGAMAAINGYSGALASKMNIVATSFIPAANRSMGASYGTMFNQLLKDPELTREQAHERALGGAMATGAVTGLITAAFAGFGKGGLDTALTRGLTRNEMKTVFSRLTNSADGISDKVFNEVIKKSLKETFKDFGYAGLGKSIAKDTFDEGVEEAADTFVNSFVEDAALNGDTPMLERLSQSFHAFVIGGLMGSTVPAIQGLAPSINRDLAASSARRLEDKAISDVTLRLNESGSPITAQVVQALLTGPSRRRAQISEAIQRNRDTAATAAAAAVDAAEPAEPTTALGPLTQGELDLGDTTLQPLSPAAQDRAARLEQLSPTERAMAEQLDQLSPTERAAQTELNLRRAAESSTLPPDNTPTQLELDFNGVAPPVAKLQTVESIEEALAEITPEEVEALIPAVRPEELETTGQMDLGIYITQTDSEKPALMAPFNMLDFKTAKPVMEQLGLNFNEVVHSELQDLASKPTIIPKVDLTSASGKTAVVEASPDQFVGDEATVSAELKVFNKIAGMGFPISFQSNVRFGMPKRDISEKATGQKSYYGTKSSELANLIYKTYPVTKSEKPVSGKTYSSERKITFLDPISGQRVSRKIKGGLDANGNGVFNNDPVLIAEMIRDGVPVRVPKKFTDLVNPSLVIRNGYVVDVLGPRADGKAGLVSMTAPIERTLTSEPDYKSLAEAGGIATLFIDDIESSRSIPSGAPVIDKSGLMLRDGGSETSVGELVTNFNQFVLNATMPEAQEGATSGVRNSLRELASTRIREMLRLRSGAELESGFFDTALQALHTEYINYANLFEVRSSLINSKIAVETPAGIVIPPNKAKSAVKLLMARIKTDSKTTVAERFAPFVNTDAKTIRKNPDSVILSYLNSEVLNNSRFDGNVMPTVNQLAETIKARYAEQQETRGIEERVKATVSMDPKIMSEIDLENLSRSGGYLGEPSTATAERLSQNEISKVLKQLEFNAINSIDEDPDLRDAFNDLLFQSVYKNPSANQVNRVVGMTTADAFGTLANWISTGNFDHPEIIKFERSLRDGEFASGQELRSALSLSRLSSRASETENPTENKEFVESIRGEISKSLNRNVSTEHAKNFIKALDRGIRKRMSRSHITRAQVATANRLNNSEVELLGIKSGDPQSVIDALKNVAKTSKNKNHKLVAELLLEDPAFIKTIKFEIGRADHSTAGEYNRLKDGSHSVFLNLNGYNGRGITNVMLEEYVHAFLSDTLNKPKEALSASQNTAVTRLNGLMELVRQQAKSEGIDNPSLLDGLENIDEFVASFLLSKDFQSLVKSVNPPQGQRGFFGRIIDAMVNIFRKVTKKESSVYADALSDIIDLSRSAMGSERITSKALFSSVAGDVADSLERAAAVRDTLPESVVSATTPEAPLSQEERAEAQAKQAIADATARQKAADEAANEALIAAMREITTASVPKSPAISDTDQTAKARGLMRVIRNMVPSEVRLKFINAKEAAELGDSQRFVASALGDEISVDMSRLMALVDGMDNLTSNMLVESIIVEELGHVASYNALTPADIKAIADSLSMDEYDAIADAYYQTGEDRKASKDMIRSEDPAVAVSEKNRLVEEHLRAHLQRTTTGHSTEENAAFLRTNPSLFKIVLRYVGNAFRRMITLRASAKTGNPYIDTALSRMLVEMRALKMGYRNGPSVLRFDPNNPAASLEAFRAITGIDDLEEIEAAAFDEDVAEALFSQIGLEDFKRIQQLSRGGIKADPEMISKEINVSDIIELIEANEDDTWDGLLEELEASFEEDYEFVEQAGQFVAVFGSGIATDTEILSVSGDPAAPEEVVFEAALTYVKYRLGKAIGKDIIVNGNKLDELLRVELINRIAEDITEVDDFGMGPQLRLDKYYADDNEETVLTVSAEIVEMNRPAVNLEQVKQALYRIDGLTIERIETSEPKTVYDLVINRKDKKYSLDFVIDHSSNIINVGSLVPVVDKKAKSSGQAEGLSTLGDSFGFELLVTLVTNNHLIGAAGIRTYAAGTAAYLRSEKQALAEAKKDPNYEEEPSMSFNGFKMWPKIGFDYSNKTKVDTLLIKALVPRNEWAGIKEELQEMGALDDKGNLSLTQLLHLGGDTRKGNRFWKAYGGEAAVSFDLTAGSENLKALNNIVERNVRLKGLIEEIKPLRDNYSRSLKGLQRLGLTETELASKEEGVRTKYKSELIKLGVNPERLLTSLGSGGNFNASSINFDGLLETLEMPMFEAGAYKAPTGGFMRALIGELDPRVRELDNNRNAFIRAATSLVTRYKATLDKAVIARYGSIANAPNDLIAEAMGSTGIEVSEDTYDAIEDAHTARLIAIRNDDTLTSDLRSEAILNSAGIRDAALADARSVAREAIIRRKDEAMTRLTAEAPEIATHIADLRGKLIDPLSLKLKKEYNMTEEFGVHIDSQLGIYMTRAYRMFNEIGFSERVKQDDQYANVRNEAIKYFERDFVKQEMRRLQLEGILPAEAKTRAEDELINKRSSTGESYGQQALMAFIESYNTDSGFASNVGDGYRVMINNLKQKRDIPPALRDILGEYKNSEEGTNNLLRTFVTVASMASNQSFLNNIKTLGERNGFMVTSDEYHKDPTKYADYIPFRASTTSKYDPLLGMYAPKEMVEGFRKTFDANAIRRNTNHAIEIVDSTFGILNKATGYAMAAKTLGSAGFYLRNALSNMLFFGPAQGFGRIDNMLKVAAEQTWKGLKDQNRIDGYLAELTALDIIGNEIQSSVIKDLINGKVEAKGIMKQLEDVMEKTKLAKGKEAVAFLVDKAGRLAAAADAVYKIAYFEHELNVLRQAKAASDTGSVSGMNEYQLKRLAAKKVLMTAQSASQAPPIVTQLTKSGLGLMFAPFLRFKAEVPRIVINTYKLAIQESRDANPKVRARGMQRFVSMTGMLGIVSVVIPSALRVLASGIGDEEDDALRSSMPEYMRGQTFYYFGSGENLKSLNLSFINPFSLLVDPTLRAMEDIVKGRFGSAASKFARGMILDQYLDDQILAGAVSDMRKNVDSTTGEPIWEEDLDGTGTVIWKALGYVAEKAYSPRILSDAIKAYSVSGGPPTEFDDSPLGIMLNGVYPVRVHDIDLAKQYGRYLREKKIQFDRVTRRKYAAYGERPFTEESLRELYDDEVNNRRKLNQDLLRISRGFEGLSMAPSEIYETMTSVGGVSKRRAGLLFKNLMDRPDINKGYLEGLLKRDFGLDRAKVLIDQMENHPRYMFVD